jgi:hypothetical protein
MQFRSHDARLNKVLILVISQLFIPAHYCINPLRVHRNATARSVIVFGINEQYARADINTASLAVDAYVQEIYCNVFSKRDWFSFIGF